MTGTSDLRRLEARSSLFSWLVKRPKPHKPIHEHEQMADIIQDAAQRYQPQTQPTMMAGEPGRVSRDGGANAAPRSGLLPRQLHQLEKHLRKHKLAFTFANEVSVRRELDSSAEAKNFALRLWWHVKHANNSLHHSGITLDDLEVWGGRKGAGGNGRWQECE